MKVLLDIFYLNGHTLRSYARDSKIRATGTTTKYCSLAFVRIVLEGNEVNRNNDYSGVATIYSFPLRWQPGPRQTFV